MRTTFDAGLVFIFLSCGAAKAVTASIRVANNQQVADRMSSSMKKLHRRDAEVAEGADELPANLGGFSVLCDSAVNTATASSIIPARSTPQIGRASCRERV